MPLSRFLRGRFYGRQEEGNQLGQGQTSACDRTGNRAGLRWRHSELFTYCICDYFAFGLFCFGIIPGNVTDFASRTPRVMRPQGINGVSATAAMDLVSSTSSKEEESNCHRDAGREFNTPWAAAQEPRGVLRGLGCDAA